jgi:23S rRNA (cytosine1962-C5)-methyltransferase
MFSRSAGVRATRRSVRRSPSLVDLQPSAPALEALRRGHPWLWRNALGRQGDTLEHGALVRLVDADRKPLALAVYASEGPLAARVWGNAEETPRVDALLAKRLDAAFARRARLIDAQTNAYRLVHGEGDGLGGVVVDRYGSVLVVEAEGGATAHVEALTDALWTRGEALGIASVLFKHTRMSGPDKVEVLRGARVDAPLVVLEHGTPFEVDVLHGQKTGTFLDQRENRQIVRRLAHGRRVLNLFSYAGGFSIQAALGGARHVTSVDIAGKAHATASRNVKLAGLSSDPFSFVTADCFTWLESAKKRGEKYDLIICDPPSMAPSEKALAKATKAYRDLHAGCIELLAEGGIFCAASCSSHMHLERFLETLDTRALGARELSIVQVAGAPPCHPLKAAFTEGAYLKFVVMT